jgi:hypothetical protein
MRSAPADGSGRQETFMARHPRVEQCAGAGTVCDPAGVIPEMNAKAADTFRKQGGKGLIGAYRIDCHVEPARTTTRELLDTRRTNVYTIETRGVKKRVYQAPWHEDGQYRGFVELVLEIPAHTPHFIREG